MTIIHAWFSFGTALREGSSVFRKPGGATVNVTRTNPDKDAKGSFPRDEKYLGGVIREEEGGCVRGNQRVPGITDKPRGADQLREAKRGVVDVTMEYPTCG